MTLVTMSQRWESPAVTLVDQIGSEILIQKRIVADLAVTILANAWPFMLIAFLKCFQIENNPFQQGFSRLEAERVLKVTAKKLPESNGNLLIWPLFHLHFWSCTF